MNLPLHYVYELKTVSSLCKIYNKIEFVGQHVVANL